MVASKNFGPIGWRGLIRGLSWPKLSIFYIILDLRWKTSVLYMSLLYINCYLLHAPTFDVLTLYGWAIIENDIKSKEKAEIAQIRYIVFEI